MSNYIARIRENVHTYFGTNALFFDVKERTVKTPTGMDRPWRELPLVVRQ